jgi:hypothetical protein
MSVFHAKMDPRVGDILLAGIRSYFDEAEFPIHEFTALTPPYHALIASQSSIGWGHLVRGHLSTLWADLQQDYMHRAHKKIKFDPKKWQRKIVNPRMIIDCHNI